MVSEYDKVLATARAMKKHGGSFVQALGSALEHADPGNVERIHEAFPEYWKQYREIAKKDDWFVYE